jgi:hypothetical protein
MEGLVGLELVKVDLDVDMGKLVQNIGGFPRAVEAA